MKKCYVAYFSYQEDHEILGIYSNRADAEDRCLSEYESDMYRDFYFAMHGFDTKIQVEKLIKWCKERKGVGYEVEEFPIIE